MRSRLSLVSRLLVVLPLLSAALCSAGVGAEMVHIPAGPFTMGSGDGDPDATPPHRRDLPEFWIDDREVTVTEYARFVEATGHQPPTGWIGQQPPRGLERLPITNITWFDALEYAVWAGKRLPTEAEWEKAARGTDGREFPWGPADSEKRRNLDSGHLTAVGSFPSGASPYGILDASGNAWEWTADWYDAYPGSMARSVEFGRKYKVIRGGAAEYYYGLENTGSATQRARTLPYGAHDFVGFRCARSRTPDESPYDPRELLAEARSRLREGLLAGRARLFDSAGKCTRTLELCDRDRFLEPGTFFLTGGGPACRMRLEGDASVVWQVHHDSRSDLVVYDPTGAVLPSLYPAAHGLLEEGAAEVKIRLAAMGEGFHMALLRDSAKRPVAVVRHFVDFEDPGRYELELEAPAPADAEPWSLEVYHANVLSVKGLHPFWSATPEQLFHPERGALTAPPRSER
jgi:formylglycine-generating enzyme required for sulfatase activity